MNAGAARAPSCPAAVARRVVLDTNVLVALWVFADSRYAPLRRALEAGTWQAITNAACRAEFERVLDYPQFALAGESRQAALADYDGLAQVVAAATVAASLPRCKDPDDQKFLELARDGAAAWLVTGDKALLVLARKCLAFRIVTPDAAVALL